MSKTLTSEPGAELARFAASVSCAARKTCGASETEIANVIARGWNLEHETQVRGWLS